MRTKIIAAGGIALAVAVGVTGCGQVQQLSAKQQVSKALSGFENAKAASFTVKLDSTLADVQAISAAQGEPVKASEVDAIKKVLAGDVAFTVQAPNGQTLGESSKASQQKTSSSTLMSDPEAFAEAIKAAGSFSATVHLSGSALVDLRFVNGVLYGRADVSQIMKIAGEDPAQIDDALTELPPALAPIAKAAKGQWVSIDLTEAFKAAKSSGALDNLATPSPTASVDPAKVQNLINSFKAAYDKQATITEIGKSDSRGQGYRLGAPAKGIAQAVSDDLVALVGKGSESQIRSAITKIPNKTFYLDVWTKDDALSAVSIDLTQFETKPVAGKKMALDIAVNTKPAAIAAPTGASAIDVKKLIDQVPGGLAGLMSSTGTANSSVGSGSSGLPSEKEARQQLKDAGLSDKEIDQILKGMPTSK